MKLFRTKNIDSVKVSQSYFGISLPSVRCVTKWVEKSEQKFKTSRGAILRRLSEPTGFVCVHMLSCCSVVLIYCLLSTVMYGEKS